MASRFIFYSLVLMSCLLLSMLLLSEIQEGKGVQRQPCVQVFFGQGDSEGASLDVRAK